MVYGTRHASDELGHVRTELDEISSISDPSLITANDEEVIFESIPKVGSRDCAENKSNYPNIIYIFGCFWKEDRII